MKNIKCRNCFFYWNEWCEKIVDSPDPEEARDCNYFREMTNADRIRAMSDEELAELMLDGCRGSKCDDQPQNKFGSVNCFQCRLDWLQQPAEEDDQVICGATNLPCIKCNPGGCNNRKEGAD